MLDKPFTEFKKLKEGIRIEGRLVKIKKYKQIKKGIEIQIHEGRKHVVKRIFRKLGFTVQKLFRIQVANIELGNLKSGKIKAISKQQLNELRKILHMRK
jgi:16S rRNA U516 pseudouridylate synthase RsuA-like enzyme